MSEAEKAALHRAFVAASRELEEAHCSPSMLLELAALAVASMAAVGGYSTADLVAHVKHTADTIVARNVPS
jgi:hypothetical protein